MRQKAVAFVLVDTVRCSFSLAKYKRDAITPAAASSISKSVIAAAASGPRRCVHRDIGRAERCAVVVPFVRTLVPVEGLRCNSRATSSMVRRSISGRSDA